MVSTCQKTNLAHSLDCFETRYRQLVWYFACRTNMHYTSFPKNTTQIIFETHTPKFQMNGTGGVLGVDGEDDQYEEDSEDEDIEYTGCSRYVAAVHSNSAKFYDKHRKGMSYSERR